MGCNKSKPAAVSSPSPPNLLENPQPDVHPASAAKEEEEPQQSPQEAQAEKVCENGGNTGQALIGPAVPLKVTIVSARGLRNADWVGKSDPYCICEVVGKPKSGISTEVVTDSLSPEWNHEATISEYCVGDSLTFTVKDQDMMNSDDILGTVTLTTAQFFESSFKGELALSNPAIAHGPCSRGESLLSVRVEVVQPQVWITVLSAKNLRDADWIGKSDPYCICEVPGRSEARFETAVVNNELHPVWNHEAQLLGYKADDDIAFIIKDSDPAKFDDALGKVVLAREQFMDGGFDGELKLSGPGAAKESVIVVKVVVGEKPTPEKEETLAPGEASAPAPAPVIGDTGAERAPDVEIQGPVAAKHVCC